MSSNCPICLSPFTPHNPEHPLHDKIHPIHLVCLYDLIQNLGRPYNPDTPRCPICRTDVQEILGERVQFTPLGPCKYIIASIRLSKFVIHALNIHAPDAAQELITSNFLSKKSSNEVLLSAANKGFLGVVQALLDQDYFSEYDYCLATIAAHKQGHQSVVDILLNHPNTSGYQPYFLMMIIKRGYLELVRKAALSPYLLPRHLNHGINLVEETNPDIFKILTEALNQKRKFTDSDTTHKPASKKQKPNPVSNSAGTRAPAL